MRPAEIIKCTLWQDTESATTSQHGLGDSIDTAVATGNDDYARTRAGAFNRAMGSCMQDLCVVDDLQSVIAICGFQYTADDSAFGLGIRPARTGIHDDMKTGVVTWR
jgi:hypothetical protein